MLLQYITLAVIGMSAVHADGVDLSVIYAKSPALRRATAYSTSTVNRYATASVIVSRMNKMKPTTAAQSTRPTSTKAKTTKTTKVKTTKSVASIRNAFKSTATKKTTKSLKRRKSTTTKKTSKGLTQSKSRARRAAPAIKVGGCAPQTYAYTYTPSTNTPMGFLMDNVLGSLSTSKKGLGGYTTAFSGLSASVYGDNYLGYYDLPSYSPSTCAAICDSSSGCISFNIYFERNPVQDPTAGLCENPAATVSVRCAIYGSVITAAQAGNIGQWRTAFMTVVTGSNGYVKITNPPVAETDLAGPFALNGVVDSAVSAPFKSSFSTDSFNTATASCASTCRSINSANRAGAISAGNTSYVNCAMFIATKLTINGAASGTYCSFYSTNVTASATLLSSMQNSQLYEYSSVYTYSSADNGTVSATLSCSDLPTTFVDTKNRTFSIKCGTNMSGQGDIAANVSTSIGQCFGYCENVPNCTAFSYGIDNHMCYMKNIGAVATPRLTKQSTRDFAWMPSVYSGNFSGTG